MIVKSPGGSYYPNYYKGGEIHCLKYSSFFLNSDSLVSLMRAEEAFIQQQRKRLRIWVDFYETELTEKVLHEFVCNLHRLQPYLSKLAIVGPFFERRRLSRYITKRQLKFMFPIKYESDPEDAKTWLVME